MTERVLGLEAIDLVYTRHGGWPARPSTLHALKGVSVDVGRGECVGVIGESGSGKSTLAKVAAGLETPRSGAIEISGAKVPLEPAARPKALRRLLQLVSQDPYGSLDPTMSVEAAVGEGLVIHRLGAPCDHGERVRAALRDVGLGEAFLRRRPHELSGGQRQRVAIARALAVDPEVVILDEPTSALDLTVQAQILNLLLALQERRGISYLLISHDIDVIRHMAHRVYVMSAGEVVENGPVDVVLCAPAHPYTQRLLRSAPEIVLP